MKFEKSRKKRREKSLNLQTPRSSITQREAMKRLKEMEKEKIQSVPCPYLEVCEFKMIPLVGRILCLDQEDGRQSQAYMAHMAKQHMWQQCRQYNERLRKEQGVLPRDLIKALKELERAQK